MPAMRNARLAVSLIFDPLRILKARPAGSHRTRIGVSLIFDPLRILKGTFPVGAISQARRFIDIRSVEDTESHGSMASMGAGCSFIDIRSVEDTERSIRRIGLGVWNEFH